MHDEIALPIEHAPAVATAQLRIALADDGRLVVQNRVRAAADGLRMSALGVQGQLGTPSALIHAERTAEGVASSICNQKERKNVRK